MTGVRTRLTIWAVMLIVAIAATGIWIVANNKSHNPGPRSINAQLLNKNDGKDNCPSDGNAGKGNDKKCQPPGGGYGNVNKNDGKDNCPNDGNAGKGNDNKNNGGCKTK